MKGIIILSMLAVFASAVPAQELDSLKAIMGTREEAPVKENGDTVKINVNNKELLRVIDSHDSTYVTFGKNKMLEVIDQPDSTRIRVGDKEISIVEKNDNTEVHFGRSHDHWRHSPKKFRGHWAGFEWGVNNFLDEDFSLSREGDALFLDLNTGRSWNINLNFAQFSLGFGSSNTGIVTGLGFEFNNYFFDNANTIIEENDYAIGLPLEPANLAKTKLVTSYLRVPLIIETQFPRTNRSKQVHISAGLVGGVKLGSHSKVMYKDGDGKDKEKNHDDFNINPLRYGLTARIGYGGMSIYGDYYITGMFIADKGPKVHPFSMGLSFTF
jgi:hypothetical protein